MITIEDTAGTVELQVDDFVIDDAQRAAVAFPARSSGRTLDAYRHDLRGYPVGGRRRTRGSGGDPSAHRALSALRQRAERSDSGGIWRRPNRQPRNVVRA